MNQSGRNGGGVPSRWLHCPRKSLELIVGKFMAFKTPLDERYDSVVPLESRFHPSMLLDNCKAKKVKFGLWIDLTNTNRFYDTRILEEYGCKYVKLQCRGHGETPTKEQKKKFVALVQHFIQQNPLHHIAIHCTHGFNRTGFLIVSYLVDVMDFDLKVALDIFAKARPPGIYKADYLQELYKLYDDIEDTPPPPKLPDWCYEDETSDNEDNASSNSHGESSSSRDTSSSYSGNYNKRRKHNKPAVFMEGVDRVYEFTEQPKAFQLQKKVQTMCGWKSKGFPGSQPVSMDMKNITLLHDKPYRVSWKADGMRYMMLIDGENEIYFFDRDHNIFHVDGLTFPYRKNLKVHLKNTLIDGEMVIDKVNGQNIPRYLAYDIVIFEGQNLGKMSFYPDRLRCIENELIKPRYMAIEAGIINRASEPFSVRNKEFWHITQAASLLGEKFAATLSHEPDGLIFQPSKEPYVAGRCDEVLKWKPLDMNSIDFRLKIVKDEGEGIVPTKKCFLYVGQYDQPFGFMKYKKAFKDLDGKIVECKIEDNEWKFMRERTDKSYPNSFNTAQAVYGSITNPITKEKLLQYIEKSRFEDDNEIMPPPSKMIRR